MMNEGKRVFFIVIPRLSFVIYRPSFLQREARAYDAPRARNFATVLAYDPGRERQAQPRAAREAPERVAVRVRRARAAPLDRGPGPPALVFAREPDFGPAPVVARLHGGAPARCDTLERLRQKRRVEVALVRARVAHDARALGRLLQESREVSPRLAAQLQRAAVAHEQRHVGRAALKARDELRDGLKLVLGPPGLLHALAQERGIEFETVELVFEVVHDLYGRAPELAKRLCVLYLGF